MRKKILIVAFFLLAAVLLSGCTGATAWPGLAAGGQTAYLANGPRIHSINLKDGKENWQYPLQANSKLSFYATPLVTPNGIVIFGSAGVDHSLFAVDPEKFPSAPVQQIGGIQKFFCSISGTCPVYNVEAWIFTGAKDHWVATPLLLNDKLFAPNADGNLYVLDVNDGSLIKQIKLGGDSNSANRLWSQPVTDGKRIFVTSLDRSVYAIDLETYKVAWYEDLSGAIPGGAVFGSDGMLYVGSLAKQLEKFDPETGTHKSVLDTKGWIWSTPVADGDNLYFSDVDGYFYSYNTKEGTLNFDPVKPDTAITADPLIMGDKILLATEAGGIYSVSQTGDVALWYKLDGKGKAYTTPVTAGDYVLVSYIDSDYYLIALDHDGNQKWTFPTK